MKRRVLSLGIALLGLSALALVPIGGGAPLEAPMTPKARRPDFEEISASAPGRSVELLFVHHSCGGQLLADAGSEKGLAPCVYETHPNGGGLRRLLEGNGYRVNEASYGSIIGEATDLFDWLPKFGSQMDRVLTVHRNDTSLPAGVRNEVVLFKSCFPNSLFESLGTPPGSSSGPELTVWNARASLSALLPIFEKHPSVLFVYLTAPPVAPILESERVYKWAFRRLLGRGSSGARHAERAAHARSFNEWVRAKDGWLAAYPLKNVAVFDYYDVLTAGGESNLSRYPTFDGRDSHPSSAGNQAAAKELAPFLNRAVRRAGLVKAVTDG